MITRAYDFAWAAQVAAQIWNILVSESDILQERRSCWKLSDDDARTEYDVDLARVIHSGSFRRLQGKTQILNLGDSDFYRTRLTHSLEVAQIASGLVRQLAKHHSDHPAATALPPISLIQAVSLTHDLGHPPFGHGGEVALNYCMRDDGGFEGNGQTLRIAARLEHFSDRCGYDFTRRAILGILKYPATYSQTVNRDVVPRMSDRTTGIAIINRDQSKPPKCFFDSEQDVVEWALRPFSPSEQARFTAVKTRGGKHGKTECKSLDASIMDVADDIAYGIHDLEDSIALRLVLEKDFRLNVNSEVCRPFLSFLASRCGGSDPYEYLVQSLFGDSNERKRCISRLVGHMIHAARFTTNDLFEAPILRYGAGLDDESRILSNSLQQLVVKMVIRSANVQHLEFKGQTMVVSVFEALASDPKSLPPRDAYRAFQESGASFRVLCDYVSGMTDGFLFRSYERLYSPRMGSVFDKL